MSTIESVLQEKRVFKPAEAFVKQANISGMDAYRKLVAEAPIRLWTTRSSRGCGPGCRPTSPSPSGCSAGRTWPG